MRTMVDPGRRPSLAGEPLSLEERRRRRDQRLGVKTTDPVAPEPAAQGRGPLTLEWAGLVGLVAAGLGLVLAVRYRHMPMPLLGAAVWIGIVVGALLSHALLQTSRRLTYLGVCLFAAIPPSASPPPWVPPSR